MTPNTPRWRCPRCHTWVRESMAKTCIACRALPIVEGAALVGALVSIYLVLWVVS